MWKHESCCSMVDDIKGQRIKSPALRLLFHFHLGLGLGFMGGVRMVNDKGELLAMAPPFLSKCYDIVDDSATDGTVSWGKNGDSFVIWDSHTFSRELLPKYFKHSNLSSFVRQLNTYVSSYARLLLDFFRILRIVCLVVISEFFYCNFVLIFGILLRLINSFFPQVGFFMSLIVAS